MDPVRDPEGMETEFLNRTGSVQGRKVLEIGCGNGRLTWRFANLAAYVVGVDPDSERLAEAGTTRPETITAASILAQADARKLPFPNEAFECAIFSWSL